MAFILGWEMYDYPLARKGWGFKRRLIFVVKNASSVIGLGSWLLIPGLQIVTMPVAVVGGTMLALKDLKGSE